MNWLNFQNIAELAKSDDETAIHSGDMLCFI